MSLNYEIKNTPETVTLVISGEIDENSDFKSLELKGANQLIIDLKGIKHLNSMGLKNWTLWIKKLPKYPAGICFRHCPLVVVHQINVLHGFLPSNAIVESIEVPFFCESCSHESVYLAERNKDYFERTADSPEKVTMSLSKKCTKCGGKSNADIIENKFFSFLKPQR